MCFSSGESANRNAERARVERHPARSGPAALPRNAGVFPAVRGGGDVSTGRRSRPAGVTLERGFDGARAGEPEVGSTRAPFVGAKRRRTSEFTGAARLYRAASGGMMGWALAVALFCIACLSADIHAV